MDWSAYSYLLIAAAMCLVPVVLLVAQMPALVQVKPRGTAAERVILVVSLLAAAFVIYGSFVIGPYRYAYRDVGSDTIEQYVPFYLNLIDGVRSGNLGTWNFDFGLGVAYTAYQSWLLDPFNLLLVPLGIFLGDQCLSFILVGLQVFKVVCSGLIFRKLLEQFCETPLARMLGALLFAFGGHLLLWGQHYWLSSVYVAYPLLLLSLESLMDRWTRPRFAFVVAVVGVLTVWSPYVSYMSLLAAAIYALLRCIQRGERPLLLYGRLVVPTVCGLVVGCVTLVPYALFTLNETSRVGTGAGPSFGERLLTLAKGRIPVSWVPAILSRLLGNSLISSGEPIDAATMVPTEQFPLVNCYEIISLGFSVGVCVLVLQFLHWVFTEASVRDKVTILIGTLLVVLYCVNYLLPAAMNLFVEPKYRSSYVLAPLICMAMAIGWERRVQVGKASRPLLAVGLVATVAVVVWSLLHTVNGRLVCLAFLAFCLLAAVLMLWPSIRLDSPLPLAALALVIVGSSVVDGFFTVNNRVACTSEDFPRAMQPGRDANTLAALASLDLSSLPLVRVEKDYTEWCGYCDSLVQGFAGVSAYNSTSDSDLAEFYRAFWPEVMPWDSTYQSYASAQNRAVLDQVLGVRYVLTHDSLPTEDCELVGEYGDVRAYENRKVSSLLYARGQVVSESALEQIESTEQRQQLLLDAIVVSDELAGRLAASVSPELSGSLMQVGPSKLAGELTVTENAVCCLAVPHTSTWQVLVDGVAVESFRANYGFVGFELPAGTHTVEARYQVPGLLAGALASLAGLVVAVAWALVRGKRPQQQER